MIIPNIWENKSHVPVTTNQIVYHIMITKMLKFYLPINKIRMIFIPALLFDLIPLEHPSYSVPSWDATGWMIMEVLKWLIVVNIC